MSPCHSPACQWGKGTEAGLTQTRQAETQASSQTVIMISFSNEYIKAKRCKSQCKEWAQQLEGVRKGGLTPVLNKHHEACCAYWAVR